MPLTYVYSILPAAYKKESMYIPQDVHSLN